MSGGIEEARAQRLCEPAVMSDQATVEHDTPALMPEASFDAITRLETMGDPTSEMAALLMKSARHAKESDEAVRKSEEAIQTAYEEREVAALRERADETRKAGWASGLASIGAGTCSVGESFVGESIGKRWKGASKGIEGAGKIGETQFQGERDELDTEAKSASHGAAHAKDRARDAADDVKKHDELLRRVLEYYKEIVTAENDAKAAAVHRA
jgi:hypothetical protein